MNKKTTLIAGIVIVLLAIFAATAFRPAAVADQAEIVETLPDEVSVEEAARLREEGAFILDVRQPEEWEAGHIPGATLIPLGELPDRMDEVPVDQKVVVVCRSGNRSAQATQFLRQNGYHLVTSMAGGMNQWAAANYEFVTGP